MVHRLSSFVWTAFIMALIAGGCSSQSTPTEPEPKLVTTTEQDQQLMVELAKTAARFYKIAVADKVEQALAELNVLNRLVPKQKYDGETTVRGLEALTNSINEANKSFVQTEFNRAQAIRSSAQVRLAIDALDQSRRPMWMAFEQNFSQDVNKLNVALRENDPSLLAQYVAETSVHFDTIRPAMIVSGRLIEAEAIQSLLHTLTEAAEKKITDNTVQLIEHYTVLTTELFKTERQTMALQANDHEALIWSLSIGLVVISVLAYVAWRRFRYERDHYTPVAKRQRGMGP